MRTALTVGSTGVQVGLDHGVTGTSLVLKQVWIVDLKHPVWSLRMQGWPGTWVCRGGARGHASTGVFV
jgi:hypothetical protein